MSYVKGCATGEHLQASQKLLNELSAARLCLLTPAKRSAYDAELNVRLGAAAETAAAPTAPSPALVQLGGKPDQSVPLLNREGHHPRQLAPQDLVLDLEVRDLPSQLLLSGTGNDEQQRPV